MFSRRQFPRHDAERENVGPAINLGARSELLGRHVARGSDEDPCLGHDGRFTWPGRTCESKVQTFDLSIVSPHDVLWLQIAMDDFFFVRHRERFGYRDECWQQLV